MLKDYSEKIIAFTFHPRLYPYLSIRYWIEVLLTFLMRDLAFVFLPLGILWAVTSNFSTLSSDQFLASPDFSFAMVTILASAISHFVHLKISVQKDHSHKLSDGIKYLTILLVFASVLMTVVLLRKYKVLNANITEKQIAILAKYFLLLGILFLFMKTQLEIKKEYEIKYSVFRNRTDALEAINTAAKHSFEEIQTAHFMSKGMIRLQWDAGHTSSWYDKENTIRRSTETLHLLAESKKLIASLEKSLKQLDKL